MAPPPKTPGDGVCAVVVTFHPDPDVLRRELTAVATQVEHVVVVDNSGARGGPTAGDVGDAVLLAQPGNVGLAAAQNVGIAWARRAGCRYVLLLDQDSVPAPEMVSALHEQLRELSAARPVAAVGPVFHDPREERDAPFVRVAFPISRKTWCTPGRRAVEADFLISSGALIPLSVLDEVGPMDEGLFIDNVDMEWSFRARAKGFGLYGVCAARMEHHLGDDRQPVLGGVHQVVRHGPVRLYFIMRNRLRLYRLPHTPRVWIAQDVPRVFAKFFIFSVLVGPRARNVRYMLRGLLDGVRGRAGNCPIVNERAA
jgi:rhamnosyltransferase